MKEKSESFLYFEKLLSDQAFLSEPLSVRSKLDTADHAVVIRFVLTVSADIHSSKALICSGV